jgi:hypothetical protein
LDVPPSLEVRLICNTFNRANSDFVHFIISGLSRKYIFTTHEEEIQDISEK